MKVVLLTNVLTPFRIFYYDMLHEEYRKQNIDFSVLVMVPNEPGRTWQYKDFERDYTTLLNGSLKKISGIDWIVNTDIEQRIIEKKPDVVVCAGSYMNPSVWKAIKLKNKLGYKVLFWSESHLNEKRDYGTVKLWLRDKFRKKVLNGFDGFWYAGKMSKAFIDYYVTGEKKFIFVPNMIEEKIYFEATKYTLEMRHAAKEKYQLDTGCKVMFMPVRLSKEKGVLEFLELLNQSSNKADVTLAISGQGPLKTQIEEKAREYGIDVHLLGFQNQKNMVELYAAADIFVLPSLSDPNPLTVIEACWARKPLLVSEHVGNNPEIVTNGQNGFVFSYERPEEAIRFMDQMITADAHWLDLAGAFSLKIAQERYNSETNVRRVAAETVAIVKED